MSPAPPAPTAADTASNPASDPAANPASDPTTGHGREPPPFAERVLHAGDGLRLYFRDFGPRDRAGPALLCLPGLTRNSKDFERLAGRLCEGRRVLCPDYRGRGRSAYDPDWRHYEARTYIEDIRHLLAATNVHGVVVIGTSLGGLLAMAMAAAMPSHLAGVVLNDVGPAVHLSGLKRILAYLVRVHPQPNWEAAVANLRRCFPNLSFQCEADWLAMARNTYREDEDGLLRPDWDAKLVKPLLRRHPPATDLWRLYRALRPVPTLALRGALSDVLTEATFARMVVEKPDLMRVTIPRVGHAPTLGEPEAAAAIDAFLAKI